MIWENLCLFLVMCCMTWENLCLFLVTCCMTVQSAIFYITKIVDSATFVYTVYHSG
jgi:hypothetical protein